MICLMWFGDDDMTPEFVLNALKEELRKRQQKNPNYSLRAYALFLELDQSALTKILNEKRALSWPIARQIIKKLKLDQK